MNNHVMSTRHGSKAGEVCSVQYQGIVQYLLIPLTSSRLTRHLQRPPRTVTGAKPNRLGLNPVPPHLNAHADAIRLSTVSTMLYTVTRWHTVLWHSGIAA